MGGGEKEEVYGLFSDGLLISIEFRKGEKKKKRGEGGSGEGGAVH